MQRLLCLLPCVHQAPKEYTRMLQRRPGSELPQRTRERSSPCRVRARTFGSGSRMAAAAACALRMIRSRHQLEGIPAIPRRRHVQDGRQPAAQEEQELHPGPSRAAVSVQSDAVRSGRRDDQQRARVRRAAAVARRAFQRQREPRKRFGWCGKRCKCAIMRRRARAAQVVAAPICAASGWQGTQVATRRRHKAGGRSEDIMTGAQVGSAQAGDCKRGAMRGGRLCGAQHSVPAKSPLHYARPPRRAANSRRTCLC